MANLLPSNVVRVGENSRPTKKFQLKDEYGANQSITSWAFRLKVYIRTKNASDNFVDKKLVDVAGTIITASEGKFQFALTHEHTSLAPATYRGEILAWSTGTVTDPPTERYAISYVVERALENP